MTRKKKLDIHYIIRIGTAIAVIGGVLFFMCRLCGELAIYWCRKCDEPVLVKYLKFTRNGFDIK